MIVITSVREMSEKAGSLKKSGRTIGFVPTMGYLHEGHCSLIRSARRNSDTVVVSIFVNPPQFGRGEDLDAYPRDFKRDERLAEKAGADIVFYPEANDVYAGDHRTFVTVEKLTEGLCGSSRPGHFRGVTTVVAKLFGVVRPDTAYFGQKDAQQAIVIKKMAADLNMGVAIRVEPIVREVDGLAMSSRNVYLSPAERVDALVLSRSLKKARSLIEGGQRNAENVKEAIEEVVNTAPSAAIDYVAIVNAANLIDLKTLQGEALIALAVFIGKTRLIDNCIIHV
ncbi:MAG: pantoate--beta-alanine ligase [Candidatus Omnitrophota bacterium]